MSNFPTFKLIINYFSQVMFIFKHSFVYILGLSFGALLINLCTNYGAFLYQWGLVSKVDTNSLESYRFIRDTFFCMGGLVGAVSALYANIQINKKV